MVFCKIDFRNSTVMNGKGIYNIKVKVIGNLENNQNISKKYYGKSSLDVALATLS